MDEYPVKLGSMLFTLVDPHKGQEVAYNRWYERDHFYAGCMIGPWLFAGRRWAATRELKDLRFPPDGSVAVPMDAGSYLAIYWVHADHEKEHFDWAGEQVHWLYSNGRGFAERDHVHTVLFDYLRTQYRDEDPVPIELALDYPYQGLVNVFLDREDGVDATELDAWLDERVPGLLADGPIACCAHWNPIPRDANTSNAPMDLGSPPGGPERRLQMFFLESDPREVWDRFVEYGDAVKSSGLARVALAAPFFVTWPGTDRYADELW
jgi:hypothetical protein